MRLHYKHLLYPVLISSGNKSAMGQVTLLLRRFLGKDVTLESVLSLDLSRAGYLEPFLGTGMCFHLWHCRVFILLFISFF